MAKIIYAGFCCQAAVEFEGTEAECLTKIDELRDAEEFENLDREECFFYIDDEGNRYSIWRDGKLERK